MGSNRSAYVRDPFDDYWSHAGGIKNNFQRDDFRSEWSHQDNGNMVQDITGNGFTYVISSLGNATSFWRYAWKDLGSHSDIRCSVVLNTALSDISFNSTAPYQGAGLILQDADTGGIVSFVLEGRPTNAPGRSDGYSILTVQLWTTQTSWSTTKFEARIKASGSVGLAAIRRGSITHFYYSLNGVTWTLLYTLDNVSQGTPYINTNRLGFGYYHTSNTAWVGVENAASFDWIDYSPIA